MMAVLQEPIDDIQVICLKLRRLIFDALDQMQAEVDQWEPAPYEPDPPRQRSTAQLLHPERKWFR